MKSQIAKLQTGLLELQNKNSVLINKVKTNNSSQSAIEELTQANKRIEDCMEQKEEQNEKLCDQLKSIVSSMANYEKIIESNTKTIDMLQEKLKCKTKQSEDLQTKNIDLNAQILNLTSELKEAKNEMLLHSDAQIEKECLKA